MVKPLNSHTLVIPLFYKTTDDTLETLERVANVGLQAYNSATNSSVTPLQPLKGNTFMMFSDGLPFITNKSISLSLKDITATSDEDDEGQTIDLTFEGGQNLYDHLHLVFLSSSPN